MKRLAVAIGLFALVGCGEAIKSHHDGATDADAPEVTDATDTPIETPPDALPDVVVDAVPDIITDMEPDAPPTTPGFVAIPPGDFTMGSPTSEPGRLDDETQHSVTLSRWFEIMAMEVTQEQFEARMGYHTSRFSSCGASCPVEQVTWHEAAAYANEMSADAELAECYTCTGSGTGVTCSPRTTYATPYDCPGYRLPTEAEWEYSARAGTTEGTYNGTLTLLDCTTPNAVLDPIAWFCGNCAVTYAGCHDVSGAGGPSCGGTNPTGGKTPNDWGLYDMLGNVREWCHDWMGTYPGTVTDPWGPVTGTNKVIRGGSWVLVAELSRAAKRLAGPVDHRSHEIGFRIVRTLP